MALLDDDELDIDDHPVAQRSDTNQPLFDDPEPTYKVKEKKDKKLRAEDKRGSIRTWGKSKESTLEKTPKKSKHNRNKSGSRTPPDSPKGDEFKRLPKGGVPPTQPSPNVKGNRKSYSQLDDISDSEQHHQGEGFTVFNQPALDREEPRPVQSTNPWANSIDDSPDSTPVSFFTDAPPSHLNTSLQDPWQASPNRRTTIQFPVDFGDPKAVSPSRDSVPLISAQNRAISPERPGGRESLPLGSTQPLSLKAFPSPVIGSRTLTSHQPVTALPPPPQPLAPPPSQLPSTTTQLLSSTTTTQASASTTTQPLPDPDWSISNELQEKCVDQFKELSSSGGLLQGDKAREFFVQSKLPNQELSAIWRLADVNRDNALSEYEFCVAMKLVMMRRKGYEIPSALPQSLVSALLPRTFSDNFGGQGRSSSPLRGENSPVNVELGEESSPEGSQTAVLVDLGDDTGESEEGDDDTALVNSHRRTGSEGSIPKKPARPAPPVPKVQRSKTIKSQSSERGVETRSSPTVETEGILINIDQGTPQISRKPNKKKDYAPLDSADSASTDHDLPRDDSTDGGFDWKQLDNRKSPSELEPPETGHGRRGHSRGRSLDLTKVIQGDSSMDVLENLPSAVPPKLPPRPHQSPPLEQSRSSETQKEEEGEDKKTGRVRSLSTGSIHNKPMSPEHHEMEMETNSLIKEKPKSVRKVRNPPRRPPPPAKPKPVEKERSLSQSQMGAKADLKEYQVPGSGTKDKRELQLRIRSLKDENAALTDLNKTLEAQLFKLMEERVKMEKKLELLG